MPRWDFECAKCNHIDRDVTSAKCDPESVRPNHCGAPMEIVFTTLQPGSEVFEPYETTHMHPDGKKLLVRNRDDLKRFQTEFGVYRVDDPNLVSEGGKFVRRSPQAKRTYLT